ncbi:MAG TPA: EAL domain-containing protein, partial [Solirubrobacteraceae bacterium]|nr:EAL domain-containing protein [Solirubrobacteraceae bacterium]
RDGFTLVRRLSWLDALMGAAAGAAVAAVAGASGELIIAIGGVAGALALSRWQPSPALAVACAGVLALGGGGGFAVLAAPLLVLAAWRREPRRDPGPEFRWTVLAALIGFATAALVLLALGQFATISDLAWTLAVVTVLAGMGRAGITVTDRLRESERRAHTDDLTGLSNRRHVLERLEAAIGHGEPLALLLIDLDGFKELNDTLGHHAGDEVLRQVGPRLAAAVREHDTLARLGGDEFALVLTSADEAAASAAGLRLRGALERSFDVEGITVHMDASIGIALYPDHSHSGLGLLQRADVAMYEAKRVRTGHEVYLPARDRHSRDRLALIGELHAGIDSGQLVLHYQPKAELAGGAVHGVEALVRWDHPTRGLLAPGHFLPLAEQSGLTRALTAFVLDRALDDIGAPGGAPGLTVAVNLGPADLLDVGLPSEVARVLERRGVAAERLKLEVSEDVIMADPERTLDVLARLREIGVGLALDDFGAGQSSLAHLRRLHVDELKIDRSFVLEVAESPRDAAIVRTTIELGRRLGLRVVAEGVTTRAAWDLLAGCRCDDAQGYYVAPPMPLPELRTWLERRTAAQGAGREAAP